MKFTAKSLKLPIAALTAIATILSVCEPRPTSAQSITPAADGTGTTVTPNDNAVAESLNTQEVEVTQNESISPSVKNVTDANSLVVNTDLQKNNISHQAADLQIEMAPTSTNSTLTEAQLLAAIPLDIDALCISFPLNSRCRGYTPPSQRPEAQPTQPVQTTEPTVTRLPRRFAITAKAGALGIGGEVTTAISPNFNARLGVNGLGVGIDTKADGVDYSADLNFLSVTALGDYFPFASNRFRFTGGLAYQNNRVSAQGEPIEVSFTSGGTTYNIPNAGTLSGDVTFSNSIAPYIGIGFGNPVRRKGLSFSVDLGVLFPGSLGASLQTNVNQAALNAALPDEATRKAATTEIENIRRDQERELTNALGGLKIYPVFSIGVSYGF